MRREPSHKSEMISQLLFGECCLVVEEWSTGWTKVSGRYDGYEGWCQSGQLTAVQEELYEAGGRWLAGDWLNNVLFDGQVMRVPHGSWLTGMHRGHASWGKHAVQFTGNICDVTAAVPNASNITETALQFLNSPYLWGGKSVFGADCSGFTQKVFQFFHIPLLRDAWQQANQGATIAALQESRCGDLAFFDNEEGRITHVGILLDGEEIVHASGKVKVDRIDDQGIVDPEGYGYTHRLKIIKRYF